MHEYSQDLTRRSEEVALKSDAITMQLQDQVKYLSDAVEGASNKTDIISSTITTSARDLVDVTETLITQVKQAGDEIRYDTKDLLNAGTLASEKIEVVANKYRHHIEKLEETRKND